MKTVKQLSYKYHFWELDKLEGPLPDDVNEFVRKAVGKIKNDVARERAVNVINFYEEGKRFTGPGKLPAYSTDENNNPYVMFEIHKGVVKLFSINAKISGCYCPVNIKNRTVKFGGKLKKEKNNA